MLRNGIRLSVRPGFKGGDGCLFPSFPLIAEEDLGPFNQVLCMFHDGIAPATCGGRGKREDLG